MVKQFVLPETPDISNSESAFPCTICKLKYKQISSLRKHIKNKHNCDLIEHTKSKNDDYIFNYSKNASVLGYLAKNFVDARKSSDGERLIRLYKYWLLYFKLDHRTKYAFKLLHLLAQVKNLLPPLLAHEVMWNRSVNNLGRVDTNVELDKELEHRNKYAKSEIKSFQGKITDESIARVSRCVTFWQAYSC